MASVGFATPLYRVQPGNRFKRAIERFVPWNTHSAKPATPDVAAVIVGEVLPRLMFAHVPDTAPVETGAPTVSATDVEVFADLVIRLEAGDVAVHVDALLARGFDVDALLVDLLAPVARRLGTMWEDDECDFVTVTMGLWRLQEVVRELGIRSPLTGGANARRALFAALPGDQHNFGTVIIDEVFRLEGWRSELLIDADMPALLRRVAAASYDVVGLTVSNDAPSARLASVVQSVRSVSRNAQLCILVGGRVFVERPELAEEIGADGTARDARAAVAMAEDMVASRQKGHAVFA